MDRLLANIQNRIAGKTTLIVGPTKQPRITPNLLQILETWEIIGSKTTIWNAKLVSLAKLGK